MTIHIENLQLKNIGPLDEMQAALKRVNLFYGLNESGKTYLVEFLLHSLFRQSKTWDLRDSGGRGSVQVAGLAPEPVTFSLESDRKIEHYWDENERGLPLNMSRLLVVKGGELDLTAGSPGGVDRQTLKVALTSQALLDQIWNKISATVRKASLVEGQVVGDKRGLIKNRSDLFEEIHDLESLLEQIEQGYSQGPAREIERILKAKEEELEAQQKSKRSLAYRTSQKVDAAQKQRDALSEDAILSLRDSIRDLKALDRDIRALQQKIEEDSKGSEEYRWLDTALEIWEEKGLDDKKSPPRALGIAGLSLMGLGTALLAVEDLFPVPEMIWIGGGIAAIGFILSLYFGVQLLNWGNQIEESQERKAIQEEFEGKFNAPLRGLVDLKTHKADLQEVHLSAQTRKSLLDEKLNQRKMQGQAIENKFNAITGKPVPEKEWPGALAGLTKESERINQDLLDSKLQLGRLNIPEENYYKAGIDVPYDPERVQSLEKEIQECEEKLAGLQSELDTLKARACERTGDDIKRPWNEILYNLQSLLEERIQDYKGLTAELVAKIGLTEVLTRLREEEDQKIVQAINTQSVTALLNKITGRYHKLDLREDQLFIQDAISSYPLKDLSTGAREQVLLALRLGLASQICGGRPLFLILDDAFQHSDWQRRETLVQSTLDLAQIGWQINYLSMDEHIRDLFLQIVKPALKKDFKLIELS